MSRLPLFDSLTHPMPKEHWLDARFNVRVGVEALRRQMDEAGVTRIMAVGMGELVGGYRELDYADWIQKAIPGACPVAFCVPREFLSDGLTGRLKSIRDAGYVGLKFHPRLGQFYFDDPALPEVIQAAHEAGLFSMICTYCYGIGTDLTRLGLAVLVSLLNRLDNPRVILLHGGVTGVLELSEAIRLWPNVLMDLSFTLLRFPGSSLDNDIACLFRTFDQRICVGSDHPQFTLQELRSRFDHFADSVPLEKASNIASGNLQRFLAGR